MHLGIYVPIFDERPAGLGTYVVEVCQRLVQGPARKVTVFTNTPQTVPACLGDRAQIQQLGLPHRLGAWPGVRGVERLGDLGVSLALWSKRAGVDVLFCPATLGPLVPLVPQVVVVHDLTVLKHPSSFFSPFSKLYGRLILPRVLGASHTIIAVSGHTRADVLAEFAHVRPGQVVVVTEGYDTEVYRPPGQERIDEIRRTYGLTQRPYLMYSGTFAGHKNVGLLPQVLGRCRQAGLDFDLAFTGRSDAGAFEPIQAAIAAWGVKAHIKHLGYVPREHLAPLMAGAFAFTFPSLYEGFGLAPLEAMASGALVLSSSRASLPEVVQAGGRLLDPEDARGWVEALTEFVAHPERALALRGQAIAQAKRFEWEDAAKQIQGLLALAAKGPI